MSFLSDYLFFNGGNECPESYHIWSAITLLSSVISRKVYLDWGQHRIYPNLYVCLIGSQGSRKTTASDVVRDILTDHFPKIPRGASVTSSQAISTYMGHDDNIRCFEDENKILQEYHPYVIIANELKHFLGINPENMIRFLTDIYDRKWWDTNYKNVESEGFPNPYVVLLACETPGWIVDNLKIEIISGGFARRLIPIYETTIREPVDWPFMTDKMWKVRSEVIEKLKKVEKLVGPFTYTDEMRQFYKEWYYQIRKTPQNDPTMEGFFSSMHTQMLKVAMLLTIVEYGDLLLRKNMVEISIALLDRVVPKMRELYSSAGRNELAKPTGVLLQILNAAGGIMLEKQFLAIAFKDMDPRESYSVMRYLEQTEQIFMVEKVVNGVTKKMVWTPACAAALKRPKSSDVQAASPPSPEPPASIDEVASP